MSTLPAEAEQRCLIFAPRGRDAPVIAEVLGAQGLETHICASGAELLHQLDGGAGFVLLSEEALSDLDTADLEHWISHQAAWSDLPFIVFASKPEGRRASVLQVLEHHANLLLLERPVNVQTMTAAAASALRGRGRQYQARRQLRDIEETERHLRLALRAGKLGSWELNLDSDTFSTSELCRHNFGYASDTKLDYRDMLRAIHPEDRRMQNEAVDAAIAQQSDFDVEYRLFWPDASLHWVQVRGQYIDGAGGRRLTGVCADVTERRRFEESLRASRAQIEEINNSLEVRIRDRTTELAQANDRLTREIGERERAQSALVQSQKMEAMGQLTGGIAHDFNNLLHVVSMNLTLIGKFSADTRVQKLIDPAKRAVDRGAKLTGQLLAFARSQTLNLQAVDVSGLLRNMGDLLKVSIGEQIPCRLEAGETPAVAQADPNQLEMAVLNLAINARDAMPDGGAITISSRVSAHGPDGNGGDGQAFVVVTVADTGTGIPPEIMAKVFDPFFTTKPSGKGTGLGLSQVYGFAQQCGGTVKIRSEMGEGTMVEIWLPLAARAAESIGTQRGEDDTAQVPARVLVIEDNADVREVIVGGLQALGYEAAAAPDGPAGLRALDAQVPDLLIVDYAMPDMNGAEVTSKVQSRWPALPVIIATGYADMRAVERLVGTDSILRKPFELGDLGRAVRRALTRKPTTLH